MAVAVGTSASTCGPVWVSSVLTLTPPGTSVKFQT